MKTNKRILSAVLASTVALSSYAAYAETPGETTTPDGDTGTTTAAENSVTKAEIPENFGGTLDGDDSDAKNKFTEYLGEKPTAAYDSGTNIVTVTFSKSKTDYGDGQVGGKDPVYLVLNTDIATGIKAAATDEDDNSFHFVSGYSWDEENHEFNFDQGKIKLWLPATFADGKLKDGNYEIKYKVGKNGEEKSVKIKYEYGSDTNVKGASIPVNFGGNLDATATEKFSDYLGTASADYADETVTVTFSKKKSEYTNNGKVPDVTGQADPVYLVLNTGIGNTVKAVGVDGTTAADGFQFTSGYGWDVDAHHEFNFANGEIKLWLPAVWGADTNTKTIKYKVGTGEEKTITINYEYEPEEEGEKTQVKVVGLTATKGIDAPETMTGDAAGLQRYKDNKEIYSFTTPTPNADGDYEMTISGEFGKMKGSADTASGGKTVLAVLAFNKLEGGYEVQRTSDAGVADTMVLDSEGDMGWYTDGEKFVATADPTKSYFTLWIALTDDRIENGMEFTITPTADEGEVAVPAKLKIDFEDTTEYSLTKASAFAPSDYNVAITDGTDGKKKVTITPATGVEIKSASVKSTALTKNADGTYSKEFDVKELLTPAQIAAGTTTVELAAADFDVKTVTDKIHLVGAGKSTKASETMTTAENERLTHNNSKITIGNVVTSTDGNYTITVDTKFGEMKGDPEDIDSACKNALIMLEFNATDDINIKKQGAASDLPAVWKEHATKFVTAADGKQYFTLWVSVTDARIADTNGVKYTIYNTQNGETQEKTLTVKFTNSTTYTLTSNVTSDDYTVTPGEVDANGEATITVKAKDSTKTITAATLTKADASTVTLTPDSNGGYAAKVAVKDLISSTDVQNGVVAKELTAADFTVTVAAQSTDMVPAGMTVGIAAPASMAEGTELTRYQNNRKLYADKLVWDNVSRTATLKVPAELMNGGNTVGTEAANVCLILELETALETEGGSYGLSATGIEDIDVEDGWKFVQGATEDDKGKYVVLWINANAASLSSGSKVVIYKDKTNTAVVATVNLVKVPGVKPSAAAKPTASDLTNTAIITAAKTLLTGDVSDDNLEFAVGTLPTEAGTSDVIVTATPKGDTVLVDAEGNVVTSLPLTVSVTVAADAKYTATAETATNGTIALKVASGDELVDIDPEGVVVGTEVTVVLTPNSGYKAGTVTVVNAVSGEAVTVTNNKFNMPAGGVTVSATFTQNQTTPTTPSGSGGSSRPSGGSSSSSTSTYLDVTNKAISSTDNAVNGSVRVDANSSNSSGVAVKVAESDAAVSYVKIDAPATTAEAATWAEPIVKKASSNKLADVKKAAEEAINVVANNKGFALNVDTLNADRKTVVPGKNVVVTVPVPSAYQGKTLYAYRVTERGVVPILASTANNKITFNAGGSGEYIFTTEKLANALTQKKGDVDNGGKANTADATLVLKHIAELNTLKDEGLYFADVNGDGKVNVADATEILKIVAGLA